MITRPAWTAALLAVLLCPSACQPGPAPATRDGSRQWYSEVRKLYHGIPVMLRFTPNDDELAERAWEYLASIDTIFNAFRAESELGRINATGTRGAVPVSPDMAEAVRISLRLHDLTDGAFDPTVRPIVALWHQAETRGSPPTAEELQRVRGLCRSEYISLKGDALQLGRDGMKLDFGGMVKGMAVDEVVDILVEGGASAALVQIGGETAAYGDSMRGRPHVIGVQHPKKLDEIWTAVVDTGGGISVATSGNYRQPIVIAGKSYYHIVDPRTALPADTRVLSVTIAFPNTGQNALADGLTTAGAVLGPETIIETAEKLGGEAFILVQDGDRIAEHKSSGWDDIAYTPK